MLTQSLIAAFAALTLFTDGAAGFKSKIGETARRNQKRAAKIVEEAQSAQHLHTRNANGTSNSTTPKRFLTKATERMNYPNMSGWIEADLS